MRLLILVATASLAMACSTSTGSGSGGGTGDAGGGTDTSATGETDVTGTTDTGTETGDTTDGTDTVSTTGVTDTGPVVTDTGPVVTDAGPVVTDACTPDCSFKQCGDDGCGTSCGECAGGETCDEGTCVPEGTTDTVDTGGGDGACTNAADEAIVAAQDIEAVTTECAMANIATPDKAPACIKEATGLSDGCVDCFAGMLQCVFANCITGCMFDPAGAACQECREEHCNDPFEECSGLSASG